MSSPAPRINKLFPSEKRLIRWILDVEDAVGQLTDGAGVDRDLAWSVVTHARASGSVDEVLLRHLFPRLTTTRADLVGRIVSDLQSATTVKLPRRSSDRTRRFTYMDLFAGIGGFHLAMESQGGDLVFASEWDRAARLTYLANHGVLPFGDIRRFTRNEEGSPLSLARIRARIPRADIVTAGFPCQPFSLAGVSSRNHHGLEHGLRCEAQGTLFEDILLIARATRPSAIILENVGNLRHHDGGNTIRVILNEIRLAGYVVHPEWDGSQNWALLDSASFSAQRRRRVYLVCIREDLDGELRDMKGPFRLPTVEPGRDSSTLRGVIDADDSLTETEKWRACGISMRMWQYHLRRDAMHRARRNGFRIGLMTDLDSKAPTLVARYYKDGKDCLVPARNASMPPRMLTSRECATLQTFPQSFRIPASKTSAYRQFGNAVTVEVARWVARHVVDYLYG